MNTLEDKLEESMLEVKKSLDEGDKFITVVWNAEKKECCSATNERDLQALVAVLVEVASRIDGTLVTPHSEELQ